VADSFENERGVSDMLSNFKTQTQEWKNVLLRGKDPKQLDRYWSAFEARDREVAGQAGRLQGMLPPGPGKDAVDKFAVAHQRMGEAYRKGFAALMAADHDPPGRRQGGPGHRP
jgi:methyl-accepting chemotaxis protein-1 (serine sensor receptor)